MVPLPGASSRPLSQSVLLLLLLLLVLVLVLVLVVFPASSTN
jgi:hypothetical protein